MGTTLCRRVEKGSAVGWVISPAVRCSCCLLRCLLGAAAARTWRMRSPYSKPDRGGGSRMIEEKSSSRELGRVLLLLVGRGGSVCAEEEIS